MISPDRPARPPVASLHDWWRTAQLGLRSTEVTAVGLGPAGPTPAVQDAIGSIRDRGTVPQPVGKQAALASFVTAALRLLSDFRP